MVSFPGGHPQPNLQGTVHVNTAEFEERMKVVGPQATTRLRGITEIVAGMAQDQVPISVIYSKLPQIAREICESAGLNLSEMNPTRYMFTLANVEDIVREQKRMVLGHNVGDLAQTQNLVEGALETHFVQLTPLIFDGQRGGAVEQHFCLMFMDKLDADVLRRRGSRLVYLDATYKVNQVRDLHLLPIVTPCYPMGKLITPCYPLLPLITPCYPLLPLVTPCYPLSPLVTPCYPLLPLITPYYPLLPLLPHAVRICSFRHTGGGRNGHGVSHCENGFE
jgi:hypothetical protein